LKEFPNQVKKENNMQEKLSEVLDNILGLLLLEGSYDIQEDESGFKVFIETENAGKLIGYKGEHLNALQLLINLIVSKQTDEFKRVIVDVSGWKQNKEEEIKKTTQSWITEVLETGKEMELEPMPSWQRRIVHMTIQEDGRLNSESLGEGRDRHLVISPKNDSQSN
jgi:spoIIIJ-associated protein